MFTLMVLITILGVSTVGSAEADSAKGTISGKIIPSRLILPNQTEAPEGCELVGELNDAIVVECTNSTLPAEVKAIPDQRLQPFDEVSTEQINADRVWNNKVKGDNVTVAVLDTGIDYKHPLLKDSYKGGYDFVEEDKDPMENGTYHGTHVSGIITIDDGEGIGVAPHTNIWMGRVCDQEGCWNSDIAEAIEYVVSHKKEIFGDKTGIISISLGGGGTKEENCDSYWICDKINWAAQRGVLVVIAAGNQPDVVSYPACCSDAVAVGAVDDEDQRYEGIFAGSGSGPALDIMAHGVGIWSADPGDDMAQRTGTSMATPHVSAAAALLLSANEDLNVDELKETLYDTAIDLGDDGWDKYYGWGRVDALRAYYQVDWCTWNDDCKISNTEVSRAEYYWVTNTPINGHIITNSEISRIEYFWSTGDMCPR